MRKSVTKITQQLEQQLAAIPGLVNQLERKSSLSMRSIGTWLLETESVLKELNMPEVSKFSVKRGELATFIPTGSSKKKEGLFLASSLLTQAQDDLWACYQKHQEKLELGVNLLQQLLTLIYQSGQFQYDPKDDFTQFIQQIWQFCSQHEQLKPISIQILTHLNKTDVLLLLGKHIELENL